MKRMSPSNLVKYKDCPQGIQRPLDLWHADGAGYCTYTAEYADELHIDVLVMDCVINLKFSVEDRDNLRYPIRLERLLEKMLCHAALNAVKEWKDDTYTYPKEEKLP
jgi:hypothetical protein